MNNFIGCYQIDESVAVALREVYDTFSPLARPGTYFNSRTGSTSVRSDVKDSLDLDMSGFLSNRPEYENYLKQLAVCVNKYVQEYEFASVNQSEWRMTETPAIQRYKPNGGFKMFHYEKTGTPEWSLRRHLVFMTFLNTIPEDCGGGTEFLYQQKTYPAKLGSTLIWPAEWTHTHRGQISQTHEKTIITGWYSYSKPES